MRGTQTEKQAKCWWLPYNVCIYIYIHTVHMLKIYTCLDTGYILWQFWRSCVPLLRMGKRWWDSPWIRCLKPDGICQKTSRVFVLLVKYGHWFPYAVHQNLDNSDLQVLFVWSSDASVGDRIVLIPLCCLCVKYPNVFHVSRSLSVPPAVSQGWGIWWGFEPSAENPRQ